MGMGQAPGTMEAALRSSGVSPSSGPRAHVSIILRARVPTRCSAGALSFSLTDQGVACPPCFALGVVDPDTKEQPCSWLVPLCPWDGCLLDWRHGGLCGGGRGAGRVLGCGCKGPGQECAHLTPCRGRGGLGGATRGGGGCFLNRLCFRAVLGLWRVCGSVWGPCGSHLSSLSPMSQLMGRCRCVILSQGPRFPRPLCPRHPRLCPLSALLWGVQPSPYVCLSAHLWPVWPPSPGSVPSGPFSAGVLRLEHLLCPSPSLFSPSLSLSCGGFQVCPGSQLVVTPASAWPADCWAGAVGFVMHMFKSLERLQGKCSASHIVLGSSVTWMNLRICPHLLFMTLSVSSDHLPCPSQ